MAALYFDQSALSNLEYSLSREILSTNRSGGYLNTTIVCCNTRKYHGLMVCPIEELGGEDYVLLSSLDETIIQHDQQFQLALHRFPGNYEPRGHKYITNFSYNPTPTITYRIGGVVLKKELLWIHSEEQLLIRYTLEQAQSQTELRLRPFLAFRNRHSLSVKNMNADGRSYPIDGGVRSRLYDGFPWLNMQTSTQSSFIAVPDWYEKFEYRVEKERGYECHEDLLTTGYFEAELKAGESIVISFSTQIQKPQELEKLFQKEIHKRTDKTEFLPLLRHSARQFLTNNDKKDDISLTAGYPWYNPRSRDTFIALAGCTLTQNLEKEYKEIIDYHVTRLHEGFFGTHLAADTQLLFFHTLSEYEKIAGAQSVWKSYSSVMKEILTTYRDGTTPYGCIKMTDNGLIHAHLPGKALTWMNVNIAGEALTPRPGYVVEINALWYNAVMFALYLAEHSGDKKFVSDWQMMPELIKQSFQETFYLPEFKYLADYVYEGQQNQFIRPNQLFACSLRYTPLSDEQKRTVLETVHTHLLTPCGIRTLSPRNPIYSGRYGGDQNSRDKALHNGTAFPWLLEHYVKARLLLEGVSYLSKAEEILSNFEDDMLNYGIGSVAELYDGDPPHNPGGAISYAPSVGALLSIDKLIEEYKNR